MSSRAARRDDGARDTVALLEALTRNDMVGARAVLDHCDPSRTMLGLATAWIALCDMHGLDKRELIASMRRANASRGGAL